MSIFDEILKTRFFTFLIQVSLADTKLKSQKPNLVHGSYEKTNFSNSNVENKSLTLLWGATGEQEWTPALTTG